MTDRWKEHLAHCRHFTGLLNKTCNAGIAYADFVPNSQPCIPEYNTNSTTCGCFELMTEQEAQATEAETMAAAAAMMNNLLNGNCPTCGAKVEKEVQVGRSVVAEPCGHRLYQGKVGAFKRAAQSKSEK